MIGRPDFNPSMILKGVGVHTSENGAIVYPYSEFEDVIDGKSYHTCGMARIVLMDTDMVSKPRTITGKHGQEKTVIDIFLTKHEYMVYYSREYIIKEDGTVEETTRGRYGEMTPVTKIAQNMKNGKKYVDNARRQWAKQEMEEQKAIEERKEMNIIADDVAQKVGKAVPFIEFS